MENYQLFDEIAAGKYSTVYKGRRKKTLDYVAIKSIDKSRIKQVRRPQRPGCRARCPAPTPAATAARCARRSEPRWRCCTGSCTRT